ncbi:MAG: hypothetical protein AAFU85_31225 [Planctomycetota bacterium]
MSRRRIHRLCCVITLTAVLVPVATVLAPAVADEPDAYAADENERFDLVVREDIFAGFDGDAKRLARGLAKCEEALAKNPEHAEAMVWRGAIRMFQSNVLFNKGKQAEGFSLFSSGVTDMNKAKELAPHSVAVMIPRAAVLINAGRSAPPLIGRPLLEAVREDFESTYERQKDVLDQIGEHPLGELRMGLADIYRLLDQKDKSKQQLEALLKELPDTEYAERATKWLAAKPDAKLAHNCLGCHE